MWGQARPLRSECCVPSPAVLQPAVLVVAVGGGARLGGVHGAGGHGLGAVGAQLLVELVLVDDLGLAVLRRELLQAGER